jgi:phenylacetate-CoA ligase
MTPAVSPLPAEIEEQLFDARRLPGLREHERTLLRWMRGHPQAPIYRNFSGHRLRNGDRLRAAWRLGALLRQRLGQTGPEPPAWAWRFVRANWPRVPARACQARPRDWSALPTMSRADLSQQLDAFAVPAWPLDELICFSTSGTTGHPLRVPSHPRVTAEYYAYHRRALALFGITPRAGRGEVGIVLAGHQERCFTYVSVNPLAGGCGLAKINLMPHEWRHADDRAAYLDVLAPELISGDPVSLAELMRLPLQHRPRALLSTSMALSTGLRTQLEDRFGAPVLDLYSMNEVGPIAVHVPARGGFMPLQPRLFIEVLDDAGHALAPGEFGEIAVTGGFNPCLPLIRYRTGDFARLQFDAHGPLLVDLQGRAPVRFRRADGGWVNNIEVTHALKSFPLVRWALHQQANGSLRLRIDVPVPASTLDVPLRTALASVLGTPLALHIEPLMADDKTRQYTSDLETPVGSAQAGL